MSGLSDIFQRRLVGITLERRTLSVPRGTVGDKVCTPAAEDNCCVPESGESGESGSSGAGEYWWTDPPTEGGVSCPGGTSIVPDELMGSDNEVTSDYYCMNISEVGDYHLRLATQYFAESLSYFVTAFTEADCTGTPTILLNNFQGPNANVCFDFVVPEGTQSLCIGFEQNGGLPEGWEYGYRAMVSIGICP